MRFALETNIISYLWRHEFNVRAKLEGVDPEKVAVPAVVLAEFVFGRPNNTAVSGKLEVLIQDLRDAYPVLDFNASAADWDGLLKARLKAQPVPDRDLMIAATCLAHGCVLVTHNGKDFERIKESKVVDWASSNDEN